MALELNTGRSGFVLCSKIWISFAPNVRFMAALLAHGSSRCGCKHHIDGLSGHANGRNVADWWFMIPIAFEVL